MLYLRPLPAPQPTVVTGVSSGSGKTINATLINTSTTAQTVIYTITPKGETGGCTGDPFTIIVNVPVCVDIAFSKTADKSAVSAVGDKIKYTITVHNNGNANHNQVVVNDPLLGGILSQPKGDNGNGILEKMSHGSMKEYIRLVRMTLMWLASH